MGSRQQEFFGQIHRAMSNGRIAPYLSRFKQSELQAYGAYAWNIALCESLYPALHGIEITLRNGINDAAVAEFKNQDWFRIELNQGSKELSMTLPGHLREITNPWIPAILSQSSRSGSG